MFVKKDARGRLRTVQDLVGMNRSFKQIETTTPGAQAMKVKADELVDEYNFYGIYRNKTNVENQGYATGSSYHQDDLSRGRNQQELINVDVFGRSKVGNMFTANRAVLRGDHLGLALCQLREGNKMSTRFVPTLNGEPPSNYSDWAILQRIPLGICSFSTRKVSWAPTHIEDEDKNRKLPQLELLML